MSFYGEAPVDLGRFEPAPRWEEFLHYLYLPVRIPHHEWNRRGSWDGVPRLPERLEFLRPAVMAALVNSKDQPHLADPYVYVTARRGFASPGNPLNRPGWHCDDFGGTDLNYIWSDRYPTQILRSSVPLQIPEDDIESMDKMTRYSWRAEDHGLDWLWLEKAPVGHLLRLSPYVVHNTPEVPAPGGMRSFFKISISTHRYDLLGNSHNYLLNYDWPMIDRQALRNQPNGNKDYSTPTPRSSS